MNEYRDRHKKTVLNILEELGRPANISEIEKEYRQRIKRNRVTRRTLRRKLKDLTIDGRVKKLGRKRSTLYKAQEAQVQTIGGKDE